MEKITFLIPVYNEEKTVGKAIEIVLGLKKIKNKEIIIIDNGSTDDSQAIIKNFKNNLSIMEEFFLNYKIFN